MVLSIESFLHIKYVVMKEGVVWHTGLANITLSCSERAIWLCLPPTIPSTLLSHCARAGAWVPASAKCADVTAILYWKCLNSLYLLLISNCFWFSTEWLSGHSSASKRPDRCLGPTQLNQWLSGGVVFPGTKEGRVLMLTTQCHLAPRLKTCGAISLLHIHAFMCWTGTPLSLHLGLHLSKKCFNIQNV